MSVRSTHPTIIVPYSREYTAAVPMNDEVKAECRKRILSAYRRGEEACAISFEIISIHLFTSALSFSKKRTCEPIEFVCRIPPRSLVPSHYNGMRYSDFLRAHPKFQAFAFDMAMLYEKADNKPFADEIRKQTVDFIRTSPKSPDLNDVHFLFPPLPGKFPVGIKRYCLEDASRNELELGHRVDLTRRLEIDVHYPAVQTKEPAYQLHLINTDWIANPLVKERLENVWDRSQPDLSPSLEEKFPIIIFSHGFTYNSNWYQNIVEPLASHGYCVITVNHPGSDAYTFSLGHYQVPQTPMEAIFGLDKQEVMTNAKDIEFVLNQIKMHPDFQAFLGTSVNFDSIGVFGHSLGGITSIETCRLMPSVVKAGLNMDGGFGYDPHLNVEIDQPFRTIQSNRDLAGKEENEEMQRKVEESYRRDDEAFTTFYRTNSRASSILFSKARHADFSLFPAYGLFEPSPHFAEIVQNTHEEVLNFFNLYLK